MPRFPLFLACVLGAAVGGAAGDAPDAAPVGDRNDPVPDDPYPIRRLRATEAQLRDVRGQLDPGPLVRLPRDEFEGRVRAAGRAVAEAKVPPRLIEARYRARLDGGDLVGTAEIDLVNAASASHFVPLDPLRIALAPAAWADGREAVIGVPAGGATAGVWVDRPGRQTVGFGWSLAGVTEPGERRFELRVPPAPANLLELELPAGQVPAVPAAEALLTGPFPVAGDPPRAGWRVRFGGRSRLDLAVRPAGNTGVPASATLAARYDLGPGHLACGFEYDLRPAKGTVGEWEFTLDPELRVTDVVVSNRAGWEVDPRAGPGGRRRLRVTLRQPGGGGKILVSAIAPALTGAGTPLPAVRPAGAVVEDERVEVHLAPGTRVENWNPGDYRLTDAQTSSDQGRVLTLVGTLLPAGADRQFRRPPALQLSANDAEFATTERVDWRIDGDRVTATVRVGLRVRRGPVFRFSLRVAPGYTFGRVTATPEDLVSAAGVVGGSVAVDFARPLGAGQTTDLVFEFRAGPLAPGPHRLPFPAFGPVGATERAGVLGVDPGSAWAAELRPGPGTDRAGWLDPFDPAPPPGAAAAFRYRAVDPDGWAVLTPARTDFAVAGRTTVAESPPGRTATTLLSLHVRAGVLPAVLATDDPVAVNRIWRVAAGGNAVASAVAVSVALLARPCGVPSLSLPSRLWVVRFVHPATGELTLETSASIPAAGDAGRLGRVTVADARDLAPPPETQPGFPPPPARVWSFSDLYLITGVVSLADAEAVFGGAVTAAGGEVLPVGLPAGAEVRSACVGGRWVDPGALRVSAECVLSLPVPTDTPARFEVRYRLKPDAGGLVTRVRSPEPTLPAPGGGVRRWWAFGPDVLPGWPVRAWGRVPLSDLPPLVGGPPAHGMVARSPAEEVRVAGSRLAHAAGVGAAALFLILAWAAGRRRHPFCSLLLTAGLLIAGAGFLLGPPWWQRAAATPVVLGVVAAGAVVLARGHTTRVPAVVALAAAVCGLTRPASVAQPPAPATVVLLPADARGRETVVAAKATLDRLAAVAGSVNPGVVFTAAEYAATVEDSTARVTGKFTAHALGGADPVLTLPLIDARLERVTVNGAAAHPASPRPGVYTVPLPGTGRHQVEVRFAVPVGGTGPEREFRFGAPDGPTAKVAAELPGGAKQAQVVGRVGRQVVKPGERLRVEADAGDVEAVQLRWRDGAGGAAAFKAREACVWDVSEAGSRLTACYLVTVAQGTVSSLRFDIPGELDPLDVSAVRRYDEPVKAGPAPPVRPAESGATTVGVRDWSVGDPQAGFRPLRIDLHGPTAGQVLVTLTLAPRQAGTRQPVLRFPRLVGAARPPAEPDAAYGLRARGVVIESLAQAGTIDFSPDALTRDRDFAKTLRLDANASVRVFRPVAAGVAELRPTLRPAADPPAVTLDTTWHLGPTRAEAAGTVRWAGKDFQPLLEFALPGVRVTEVRGADVAGWGQAAGRVQVWLRRAAKEGEVAWAGTVAPPASPFEAITPRVPDGRLAADTVRLRAVEGFTAAVERGRGWASAAPADPLTFRTTAPAAPPVRVTVSPAPQVLRPDELGWLGPPRAKPAPVRPAVTPPPPRAASPPVRPETPVEPVHWAWPVSATAGWCVAVVVLAVLLARFPRSTWPEQFGIVGGLFGVAVAGGWWVGPAAWLAARVWWLAAPAPGR